ncbi:MAG TPA: chromosome segregation protein SMC [Longimicrobium sp.]|jgi:chromosome segregation protein|uniref:chromosome segregation protein SMC n=1 Tax=Longimicrobium sp. TaxID=2029185 RepID=UPI002EDBA3F3
MKLRSLQLHGFKSFPDKTVLELRDGVTAIVGSNGCGKSNTADAVRWVLGETRAGALRSGKMEEVIFQGSFKRRPLNYAEVSLVFSNEDGSVAIPQSEIEIARKVFREGGSEYFLNRQSCRLRDIHDLLRDTGLGANAYSIIEGGMIDAILSERPDERRAMFEEAAGIGRYKDRRKAAQRRLEAAEVDLSRLNDLVGEVESKVRALARQRRKAQRHMELQARRLDLEMAIAQAEVGALEASLAAATARLAALEQAGREAATERATAEAIVAERRIEAADLTRRRGEVAARLDDVRRRLDTREREILLADERRSHAEMRIAQLVRERGELAERAERMGADAARLEGERARAAARLEGVRERLEARLEENEAVRATLASHRRANEEAAARARELARDTAAAEGERTAADRRQTEAAERIARLSAQEAQVAATLRELESQTELWSGQSEVLRDRLNAALDAAERAREEVRVLRGREASVRDALRAADDRLSRLSAQVSAREALERSYEGFSPAVSAIMAQADRFSGVLAPLADFVRATTEDAATSGAVESFLGALLQALVVRDLAAARRVRRWFRDEWDGGGTLLLLPLDAPGVREAVGAVHSARLGVAGHGEAAAWVDTFLAGLTVVAGEDELRDYAAGSRVDALGDTVDPRGVIRLGEPVSGEGILARREALARFRSEVEDARVEHDRLAADRAAAAEQAAMAEEQAREAEEYVRRMEGELRQMDAEAAAHGHQQGRIRREREEVGVALGDAQRLAAEMAERIAALDARLAALQRDSSEVAGAAMTASAALAELDTAWEAARDEESELRVAAARAEGELRELERALGAATQGAAGARGRGRTLEAEAEELRRSLEGLSGIRDRAGDEVQGLFADRDREAAALANLDTRLGELDVEVSRAEERARVARRRETEAGEERHRLELERAEQESRRLRASERVEAEWGRPWEVLVTQAAPVEQGTPDAWRAEVREVAQAVDALGPINMLAVQEHEEEDRRLQFLLEQQGDLTRARDDLTAAIRQINRTAREVFMGTFTTVRENFHRTFQSLFQGGEADVWLADPDDPLESPIEIHASPRGKKTQRIHLLSGGERTLTALSLLFAIYLVKPSPFCLFDEVDAPLDESNVGRFIQLLNDFKAQTQFIVITHNPRTMEAADWIYGVTMEEPGVSTIVGVELEGAWPFGERVA